MRAITSAWTGNVFQDKNMTEAGEMYAREIIELFDRANTLSEFNSATYTGVSLLALTMWAKYAPETSVMKSKGREMLQYTLGDGGQSVSCRAEESGRPLGSWIWLRHEQVLWDYLCIYLDACREVGCAGY